jgi:hypothetical protein
LHVNETTISFPFEAAQAQEVTTAIKELLQTFKDKQAAERPKRWKAMEYRHKGGALLDGQSYSHAMKSCDIKPDHQFLLGSWPDNQKVLPVLDGECLTWQRTGMQGMFAGRWVSLQPWKCGTAERDFALSTYLPCHGGMQGMAWASRRC